MADFDTDKLSLTQIRDLHTASIALAKLGPWKDVDVLVGEDNPGQCALCRQRLSYAVLMQSPNSDTVAVGAACGRTLVKNQMKVWDEAVLREFMGEAYDFERAVQKLEAAQKAKQKSRAADRLKVQAETLLNHPGANAFAKNFAAKAVVAAERALSKGKAPTWTEAQAALLTKLVGEAQARAKGESVVVKRRPGPHDCRDRQNWLLKMDSLMAWGIVPVSEFLTHVEQALDGEFITARTAVSHRRAAQLFEPRQDAREIPIAAEYLEGLAWAAKNNRATWSLEAVKSWAGRAVAQGAVPEWMAFKAVATEAEKKEALVKLVGSLLTAMKVDADANDGILAGLYREEVEKGVATKLLTVAEADELLKKLAP